MEISLNCGWVNVSFNKPIKGSKYGGTSLDTFLPVPMKYVSNATECFWQFSKSFFIRVLSYNLFSHPIVTHTLSIVYLFFKKRVF